MYEGNPWKIGFGPSEREVRVSEGSSYRESTVLIQSLFAAFDYYDRWEKIQHRLIATTSRKRPLLVSDHFVMCTNGGRLERVWIKNSSFIYFH